MGFISFLFKAICTEKFVGEVWGVEFGMWMAAFQDCFVTCEGSSGGEAVVDGADDEVVYRVR
jgi:hypothetical protein